MPSSIDYLVSTQHEMGGWGYHQNHKPVVEPTALVLLALRDQAGIESVYLKGINWLLSCQHKDGGWGINRDDAESGWHTSWALLALKYSHQSRESVEKAVQWLTGVGTLQHSSEEFHNSNLPTSDDPATLVWSWLPEQVGWIEPTALAVIAMGDQELSPLGSLRIRASQAYFQSNRTPSGGWDIGNAGPLDVIAIPRAYTTALVLLALAVSTLQDFQKADISALNLDLRQDQGVLAQASGLLALQGLGEPVEDIISKILSFQLPNGSWEDNPYLTAWATIALRGHF